MTHQRALHVMVTRGEAIESQHQAALAVVDAKGMLVAAAGDPNRFAYFRSSAKPFQAIPVVESGAADAFGLSVSELAFCCASHNGEARQVAAVGAMLEKIGIEPGMLQCGVSAPLDETELARVTLGLVDPSPVQNNCSGKHAGMLASCLQMGYPTDTYLSPEHPLQVQILEIVADAMQCDASTIALAADGCSVPTFGASLTQFATAYAALAAPFSAPSARFRSHGAAIGRLLDAMVTFPENIAGKGELDTELMRLSQGKIVAKIGAEGLLCMALPEHELGIAMRIYDGSYRGLNILAVAVLEQLGLADADVLETMREELVLPVTNANGWRVGEMRTDLAIGRVG